jgi:hypothetical protein
MRLVQRCGVNYGVRVLHAGLDERFVADGTYLVGKWGVLDVDPSNRSISGAKTPNQGLAEVAATSSYDNRHSLASRT